MQLSLETCKECHALVVENTTIIWIYNIISKKIEIDEWQLPYMHGQFDKN